MSTETTNKKIKIDNGTTFGKTYTDKAVDERLQGLVSTATFTPVKEKANNSLQKLKGLTKTKLVGVGANGQENIEIGDNLTLANGKLSAMGGGSVGDVFDVITLSEDETTYTGTLTGTKPIMIVTYYGEHLFPSVFFNDSNTIGCYIYTSLSFMQIYGFNNGHVMKQIIKSYYSHFITLTNSTSTFYFTYQDTSEDKLITLDSLKTALAGKYLLCTGHTDSDTAEYISGEGANIVVGVVDKSDNSTSGITIDSSFTITDLVSPVE